MVKMVFKRPVESCKPDASMLHVKIFCFSGQNQPSTAIILLAEKLFCESTNVGCAICQ